MWSRRYISTLLATVLILGTVVSPLVHYTWMATSEWFAHAPDMHDAHGTSTTIPLEATSITPKHITCDYDSIFATAQATTTPAADVPVPLADDTVLGAATDLVPATARFSSDQPRGPPAA